MERVGDEQERAALAALAGSVEAIRLPPADLPGWSSLCATEYRLCVARLAAEIASLHAVLVTAAMR